MSANNGRALAVCYTLFGLVVIGSWWKFRPRPFRENSPEDWKDS